MFAAVAMDAQQFIKLAKTFFVFVWTFGEKRKPKERKLTLIPKFMNQKLYALTFSNWIISQKTFCWLRVASKFKVSIGWMFQPGRIVWQSLLVMTKLLVSIKVAIKNKNKLIDLRLLASCTSVGLHNSRLVVGPLANADTSSILVMAFASSMEHTNNCPILKKNLVNKRNFTRELLLEKTLFKLLILPSLYYTLRYRVCRFGKLLAKILTSRKLRLRRTERILPFRRISVLRAICRFQTILRCHGIRLQRRSSMLPFVVQKAFLPFLFILK